MPIKRSRILLAIQRFFNSPKAESLSCYKPYTKGEYKESYLNIKRPCNNPVRYDLSKDLKSVQKRVLTDTNRSIQKQPSRLVLKKRRSENMQQIYRRTPMPKCDLNKVALQIRQIPVKLIKNPRLNSEVKWRFEFHWRYSSVFITNFDRFHTFFWYFHYW